MSYALERRPGSADYTGFPPLSSPGPERLVMEASSKPMTTPTDVHGKQRDIAGISRAEFAVYLLSTIASGTASRTTVEGTADICREAVQAVEACGGFVQKQLKAPLAALIWRALHERVRVVARDLESILVWKDLAGPDEVERATSEYLRVCAEARQVRDAFAALGVPSEDFGSPHLLMDPAIAHAEHCAPVHKVTRIV